MKRLCLLFCLFCLPFACPAQETAASGEPGAQSRRADSPSSIAADLDSARFARIDRKLETLVERDSTFARTVDVTAGRLPLTELLRNIARASGVNLSVRASKTFRSRATSPGRVWTIWCVSSAANTGSTSRLRVISFRFPCGRRTRPQPDPEFSTTPPTRRCSTT